MEEKKLLEEKTEFAKKMQAENNKLLQVMSDEDLMSLICGCIDQFEDRGYSMIVSISGFLSRKATGVSHVYGDSKELATTLAYLMGRYPKFDKVVKIAIEGWETGKIRIRHIVAAEEAKGGEA